MVVPWSDTGCVARRRNWEWVRAELGRAYPDWPVVVGGSSGDEFSRAEALLRGAAACDADVLVMHDADVWLGGNLGESVQRVIEGAGWAVPHWHLLRLAEDSTADVLAGAPLDAGLGMAERPYKGNATGTLVVMQRSLLFSVPPDVRFRGWGQEDEAWGGALETLCGKPVRGSHDLFHLWHPEPVRMNRREGNLDGVALRRRYDRVVRDKRGMRRLADEAFEAWESLT